MTVNEVCKEKKKLLGYSNAKVSELSTVPLATVNSFFASAAKVPSLDTAAKICKALEISIDGLYGIIVPGMSAHEEKRVHEDHEKYKLDMTHTIDLYSQQAGHQEEVIARLDDANAQLKDRVDYMKTAIKWLRLLCGCLAAFGVAAIVVIVILARLAVSLLA